MTNQHHADAITSLAARLIAEALIEPDAARAFAADFIHAMVDNGWVPRVVPARTGTSAPADPERVHSIVEQFHASRNEGESA